MTNVLFLPVILVLVTTFAFAKILLNRTTFKEFINDYLIPFLKKLFV